MSRPYQPLQRAVTYTVTEAAKHTGGSVELFEELRRLGKGPQYFWHEGEPRYTPEALNSWVRAHRGTEAVT